MKIYWNISLYFDQRQEQEIRFLLIIFYLLILLTATTLGKKNMGRRNFKEYFKFHNFSELFYCGMTRLRNTNLDVFIQCQYTKSTLRNKNIRQSLFKKHSKFQKFNEILCCRTITFRNVK